MVLGIVQKSYHSPEGGGVIHKCEKGVRQGGGVRLLVEPKHENGVR